MKRALFLVLSLVLFLSALSGAEPKPRVFRVVGVGESFDDLFYDQKGAAAPISANLGSFSTAYPAPSGRKLSLYRFVAPPPDAPAGTKPQRTVVAEIPYPADADKVIVLLYPGAAGAPLSVAGMALPDRAEEHAVGHARIFNLSSLPAAVGAGKTVAEVPPHSTDRQLAFAAGPKEVKVAAHTGGGWQIVSEMERNLPANLRLFVLLVDAPPSHEDGPPVSSTLLYDFIRPPFKPRNG